MPAPADLGQPAQWTAVAVFVAVLGWLLFRHLPAKDQQVKEMADAARAESLARARMYQETFSELAAEVRALRQEVTALREKL